jgi:cytochrome c peroxidase
MGMTPEGVVRKLSQIKGYAPYFSNAFGSPSITIERLSEAIAAYERTRMSGNSPVDRWQAGDERVVSEEVKMGWHAFKGWGCVNCHTGPNYTDNAFHTTGVGWDPATRTFSDPGRFAITKVEQDKGAFKTPSLRDLTRRAPYMHDGSLKTLNEVVLFYLRPDTKNKRQIQNQDRRADQIHDMPIRYLKPLVKFLEALDGTGYEDSGPSVFPN